MRWRAIVVLATLPMLLGIAPARLDAALAVAQSAYTTNVVAASTLVGRDTAYDYLQRLIDDRASLALPVPRGARSSDWNGYIANRATLDLSVIEQILTRRYRPLASIRGLGETLLRSSLDGTMQPVAVYVPATYCPGTSAPLVVFLHGMTQAESDLLAPLFVGALAESTGSIVIAPYARGAHSFRLAPSDVYDAFDAAAAAFTIDARKRFLVGYSMGGFTAYQIGPMRPTDWSAVLTISGGLIDRDTHRVIATMNQTPFYVLAGSSDATVPDRYSISTVEFLQASSVPVSLYLQTGGTHVMSTLLPALTQAWDDMHDGVVRSPPPTLEHVPLVRNAPHGIVDKSDPSPGGAP